MERGLPPRVQNLLNQFQYAQQQLQIITSQRQQLILQLREIEKALEELNKIGDDAIVYRAVGPILVRADVPKLKDELTDRKELLETQIKSLERQEEKLRNRVRELQIQIQQAMSEYGAGGPTGAG